MGKRDRVGWRGYLPAIVTPFDQDRALDLTALGGMLDWLHGEGMHGLLIAGTTGEWTSLSAAERADLFSAAAAQMKGKLPLIAGCSALRVQEVIDFAGHAADLGFDGVLMTPPPYLLPNDAEIVDYYRFIASHVRLPICVYNWPPGTGIDMSVELLSQLADIDKIVAVKQSSPDLRAFVRTVFELGDKIRVFGYSMDEHGLALLAARGGDGTMGAGGVLGRDHADFYNHVWAGDIDAARACGQRDRAILNAWYTPNLIGRLGSGPAIMKAALNVQGLQGGRVRFPLRDLDEAAVAQVRATLQAIGRI